jgi:hypothetical protein
MARVAHDSLRHLHCGDGIGLGSPLQAREHLLLEIRRGLRQRRVREVIEERRELIPVRLVAG